MANKNTSLSITIRTVDEATAKLKVINARLDAMTKPTRDFQKALSDLREKSGLNNVIAGFKGVGSAIGDVLSKAAMLGGVLAGAALGAGGALVHLAHEYDELGKTAARLGVGADFLAGMRDAAERTGVPIEALDGALDMFAVNVGKARAGAGRMAAFLPKISTNLHADFGAVLLRQLKAAKGNAAALDVLADAMSRLKDPAEQAALAMAATGDAKLAPLLAKGPKGLKELLDHYKALAPGQAAAAKAGEEVGRAMADLSNATDGAKAALLIGMKPALLDITDRMTKFLTGHQAEIAKWAEDIGKKLPGAIQSVVEWLEKAWDKANKFVDAIGGIKNAAIGLATIALAPLIKAVLDLGGALLTAGGRAADLARGMGSIPSSVGGAGAAAGASGGAAAGGVGILGSLAWPVALGFGAKYLLGKAGLDDLGGGNELVRKVGNKGFVADWLKQGGYADEHSPLELAQAGIDRVRDAANSRPNLATSATGGVVVRSPRDFNIPTAKPGSNTLTVDFKNAPRGTRVNAAPNNTDDIDLSIGYMLGGL